MSGTRRRPGRTVMAAVGVACVSAVAGCGGDRSGSNGSDNAGGSGTSAAPVAGGIAATGATATAGSAGSTPKTSSASPCDLLPQSLAGQILGKPVPAADVEGPTTCGYSLHGDDYGDGVTLAIDKWVGADVTVQTEVSEITRHPNAVQPVAGLSPDAVVILDTSNTPDATIAVVWKAGEVQKLVVFASGDLDGVRARAVTAAQQIYQAERH
ncbi:hypothetical protein [Catenulispora subtropica]|uniref:DUF3558 domain-containing protein n=1 Tax=Catenulispora subtropica TaxID=450798 RepID=A0ABN2S2B8_9ACTN